MDLQEQRVLQLLNELERDEGITQRTLAKKLGVALGLTNLYLKRLARKGYIKIRTIPRNRIKYLLTPRGVAQKSRLTYEYMQYSLSYYRDIRRALQQVLAGLSSAGSKRLVIYGTGELAELAYLSLWETDLTLVGFFVDEKPQGMFLSHPLWSLGALRDCEFDAVLIADLEDNDKVRTRMICEGIPTAKIVTLRPFN